MSWPYLGESFLREMIERATATTEKNENDEESLTASMRVALADNAQARAFFENFPKGADLHHHLSPHSQCLLDEAIEHEQSLLLEESK